MPRSAEGSPPPSSSSLCTVQRSQSEDGREDRCSDSFHLGKQQQQHRLPKEVVEPKVNLSKFVMDIPDAIQEARQGITALSRSFTLGTFDVGCGRGQRYCNHPGNIRFRDIVNQNVDTYIQTPTKAAKTALIISILSQVRCGGGKDGGDGPQEEQGRFVKQQDDGTWVELGDAASRDKVSNALRSAVSTKKGGGSCSGADCCCDGVENDGGASSVGLVSSAKPWTDEGNSLQRIASESMAGNYLQQIAIDSLASRSEDDKKKGEFGQPSSVFIGGEGIHPNTAADSGKERWKRNYSALFCKDLDPKQEVTHASPHYPTNLFSSPFRCYNTKKKSHVARPGEAAAVPSRRRKLSDESKKSADVSAIQANPDSKKTKSEEGTPKKRKAAVLLSPAKVSRKWIVTSAEANGKDDDDDDDEIHTAGYYWTTPARSYRTPGLLGLNSTLLFTPPATATMSVHQLHLPVVTPRGEDDDDGNKRIRPWLSPHPPKRPRGDDDDNKKIRPRLSPHRPKIMPLSLLRENDDQGVVATTTSSSTITTTPPLHQLLPQLAPNVKGMMEALDAASSLFMLKAGHFLPDTESSRTNTNNHFHPAQANCV